MQISKDHIRQIIVPCLVDRYFLISQKMSILTPGFQLNQPANPIITYLDAIPYYKRKVGSVGIYIYLYKNINAIVSFDLDISCFGGSCSVHIHFESRTSSAH